jgi:hypothetical protein
MKLNSLEVLAEYSVTKQSTELYIRQSLLSGDILWARDILWGQFLDGTFPPAVAELSDSSAQQLMDLLWRAGFRPAEAKASVGQTSAIQAHLNDMRKIVAKSLKMEF